MDKSERETAVENEKAFFISDFDFFFLTCLCGGKVQLTTVSFFWYWCVQLFFAVICIITSLLIIFGVKNMVIRKIQLISMIASTVMFAVIMFVSGNTFVNYA